MKCLIFIGCSIVWFDMSDCKCFIVTPWKFMFLKLAYLPLKLCFSGKYLFNENQISAGQLSADSSSTETLYRLIRAHKKAVSYIFFAWIIYINASIYTFFLNSIYCRVHGCIHKALSIVYIAWFRLLLKTRKGRKVCSLQLLPILWMVWQVSASPFNSVFSVSFSENKAMMTTLVSQ